MPLAKRPAAAEPRGVAWGWLVLWLVFVVYAARFAPPEDAALTRALVRGAFTGHYGATDPAIAAVFSALGVIPVLVSSFLLRDGATRKLPAWPFVVASFAVGAFAILPYLAFRRLGGPRAAPRSAGIVRRVLSHIVARLGIAVSLVALTAWALGAGSLRVYGAAFRGAALVHVMTLDAGVCTALLFVLVEEARARPDLPEEGRLARGSRWFPLFGAALWNVLVSRPP